MPSFKKNLLVVFAMFFVQTAWAGGAIQTNINGLPLHWDHAQGSEGLIYNPEGGVLKSDNPDYDTNAECIELVNDAFYQWRSLETDLNIAEGSILPDVDTSNYISFLSGGTESCYDGNSNTPCINPVIFDEDGSIINQLFGNCANTSILGFAGPDDIDDGSGDPDQLIIRHGQALFSGACLPPALDQLGCGSCKRILTDAEIRTIILHEVGHLMGMDHSQLNPTAYHACALLGACPPEYANALPTMFPILVKDAQMEVLHTDDISYFRRLYGDVSNTCSVAGTVFADDGSTELRGAEVVAKNINPDLENADAISFVSGAEAPRITNHGKNQGNCKSNCGDYLITGLSNGQTYQICAQKINAQFTSGSSIEPVVPPFQGFSDICPKGLTVTCDCSPDCTQFTRVNITTDADPSSIEKPDEPVETTDPEETQSGGCSLAKPQSGFWKFFFRSAHQILS